MTVLWDGILMLPIVGTIDSKRSQDIMEVILNKIADTGAKVIILDILGVSGIDSAVASHLIKITQATKLMGCPCVLTGVSPEIAQTVVHLGLPLGDIITKATLKDGLSVALDQLDLEIRPTKAGPAKVKGA